MPVDGLFHISTLDFRGLLPATQNGNSVLLVLTGVEKLTRWRVVHAHQEATSEEVSQFLWKHTVARLGAPVNIITWNFQCFDTRIITKYVEELHIRWRFISVYSAQPNGKTK